MIFGIFQRFGLLCALALTLLWALPAHAQQVRISGLADVGFGPITNFNSDLRLAQNVCAHSTATSNRYRVTAVGSGSGGALTLATGAARLPYEVQWAASTGQTTGTNLPANISVGGFTGNGFTSNCFGGAFETASLIVILRSNAINAATAGAYTGTLTLILAPN